jgi:hypothetical protein
LELCSGAGHAGLLSAGRLLAHFLHLPYTIEGTPGTATRLWDLGPIRLGSIGRKAEFLRHVNQVGQ